MATAEADRGGPKQPLIAVKNLRKYFGSKQALLGRAASAPVRAVDGISFSVRKGDTLGVVGKSGCGKSTMARLLIRLIEPDEGEIILDGQLIGARDGISVREMRSLVQMVFQDSYASLNPRLPIEESVAFGPISDGVPSAEANERAIDDPGESRARPAAVRPPLPARAVRRPAPARQHRPGAGARSAAR